MTKENKGKATKVKLLSRVGVMALLASSMVLSAHAQAKETTFTFDMPSQSLNSALKDFGVLADKQLMFSKKIVNGKQVEALHGELSSMAALEQLLNGTGLEYKVTASGVILVVEGPVAQSGYTKEVSKKDEKPSFQLAQVDQEKTGNVDTLAERIERASQLDEEVDEITVTGSRIAKAASQVAAHVIVIDRLDLEATGEISLERALRRVPQNNFGTSEFGAAIGSSLNGAINVTGGSTINLRGLGSESTLILIDGRRIGQSGLFGGASDISGIPISSVERIEIMLDGASSIYGSDAVGGVVNIILRKDYKGIEASYSLGLPDQGGFTEHLASVSGGMSWDTGRVRASYEFFKTSDLDGSERQSTAFGTFSSPGNVFGAEPLYYIYQGQNFLPSALPVLPTTAGVEAIFEAQIPAGQNGIGLTVADFTTSGLVLANNDEGRSLIPAQERHTFQGGLDQKIDVLGGVNFSANMYYSTKDTQAGTGAMTLSANVATSDFLFGLPNPLSPFEGAFSQTQINWLIPELPTSYYETKQDVFRWNAGLDGDIGSWKWSLDGGVSREKINTTHFNAQVGLPEVDALINSGLNLFASDLIAVNGLGLVSQLQSGPLTAASENKQSIVSLGLNGPLFNISGGAVHLAIGGELSKTSLDTESQTVVGQGGIGIISNPEGAFAPTTVSSSRSSAYGELLVPLVSSDNAMPLVEQLTLTGSARYDDYKIYGDEVTWSAGAVWSPDNQIRFKINHATSFVVPTPREALIPPSFFDFTPFGGLPTQVVDENGFPTGAVDILAGQITGGNPDLEPETADSTSIRMEVTPDFVTGLTFGATWHKTSYENKIGASPVSFFGLFLPDLENYPELVYRDASGGVILDFRATNITAVEVEGIDYDARYTRDTDIGQFTLTANIAYTSKWRQINAPGAAPLDLLGVYEGSSLFITPKYRYSASMNWSNRGIGASLDVSTSSDTATITPVGIPGTFTQSGQPVALTDEVRRTNKTPLLTNLSLSYDFDNGDMFKSSSLLSGASVSLRVVNVFNDQPELEKTLVSSGEVVTQNTQIDFNANLADPRGRVFYLSLKKKF